MVLSFGLIGGGGISHSHILGATFEGLAQLKAGCFSRNREKALQFGHAYGLNDDRIYDDYKLLAECASEKENKLDFVIVTTPNASHYEICKEFLLRGIGVVCEKPVTVTVSQAEELERIARGKNLLCMTTYTYGGLPFIHLAKEIYESGEIGSAYFMTLKYYRGGRLAEIMANDIKTWRFTKAVSGQGGTIGDLGTHVEYLARFVLNSDIKRVSAKLIKKPGNVELDTTGTVMFEFENGVDGTIAVAQAACGHDNDIGFEILGEKGSINWSFSSFDKLKVDYLDGRSVIHRDPGVKYPAVRQFAHRKAVLANPAATGFINIYTGFIKTLISKKENENTAYYYPTLSDGVKGVKFVEACVKSQDQGNRWIEI
jgi:predicted dehydrogenase